MAEPLCLLIDKEPGAPIGVNLVEGVGSRVIIYAVTARSAAALCMIREGDELLSIDDTVVNGVHDAQTRLAISGTLRLLVRREPKKWCHFHCCVLATAVAAALATFGLVATLVADKLHMVVDGDWQRRLPLPERFYLHGEGALDFRGNISKRGRRPLGPYNLDALLVPALYGHPARTYDRTSTRLHILALAPSLAPDHSGGADPAALLSLPEWTDPRVGIWFLAPGTDGHAFGRAQKVLAERSNTHMLSLDRGFAEHRYNRMMSHLFAKSVTVPYLARQELLEHACAAAARGPDLRNRSGFMFHGDTGRYDGGVRAAVRDLLSFIPNSNFSSSYDVRHNDLQLERRHQLTLKVMLQSRFCLVPRGDDLSSARLFEVMAAGCLPILVRGEYSDTDLPFKHLIDWRTLVTWLIPQNMSLEHRHQRPPDEVMRQREREALGLVRQFSRTPISTLERVQMRIVRVACTTFNPYTEPNSLIDYMLDEIRCVDKSQKC